MQEATIELKPFTKNVNLMPKIKELIIDLHQETSGKTSDETRKRISICLDMIGLIIGTPYKFEEKCTHSISVYYDYLWGILEQAKDYGFKESMLPKLVSVLWSFAFEYKCQSPTSLNEISQIIKWVIPTNQSLMNEEIESANEGPFIIWRNIYAKDVMNFKNKESEISKKIDGYNEHLSESEDIVKKALENAHFISLYHAFDELTVQKRKQVKKIGWLVTLYASIPFTITLILAILNSLNFQRWESYNDDVFNTVIQHALITLTTTVPFLLFSIYWFRIKYLEYKSESAVLLQLDLRRAICQFIQGYGDWCAKQDAAKVQLDKFASMIFSNVTPDPTSIPSVFDGIDQFANLINSVKNPNKS